MPWMDVVGLNKEEFQSLYENGAIRCEGTTYFFRYPGLMNRLADYVLSKPRGSVKNVLFAPCSIGCEPLTFAMVAQKTGVFEAHPDLRIYGLDISENFLRIAREGSYEPSFVYPTVRDYHTPKNHQPEFFKQGKHDHRMYQIDGKIHSRVCFLPPQDILEHSPDQSYSMTVCLNLFLHLDSESCVEIFNKIVSMTKGLVCLHDFGNIWEHHVCALMEGEERRSFSPLNMDFKANAEFCESSPEYALSLLLAPRTDARAIAMEVT